MLVQILVLILLIFLNGIFASSEIAFLSLNKLKIKKMSQKNDAKGNKAKKIRKLLEKPSAFLATIQIGITLAGFLASAFAAEAFADKIVAGISASWASEATLKTVIVILVTCILSYFTLVFGELIPKRIAMTKSEKIAFRYVNMIYILMKVTYPFVWILTFSTNIISKILGIKENEEEKVTEEEIKMMIEEGKRDGTIEASEKELIYNIFKLNDLPVKKIMTPRDDMKVIDVNMNKSEVMDLIKNSKYTRFPVYEDKLDNIIGILNVKEIIKTYSKGNKKFDIRKLMDEDVVFVNEKEIIDDVFELMKERHDQMFLVSNDRRKITGLVTMEDILEEIVGNIFDEYDD